MKKYSVNLLHVCVGDTVEICFTHEAPPRTFNMRVGTITRRYGNNIDGTRINPLVAGTIVDREKTVECDLKFVSRVISRAKVEAPKRNVFREFIESDELPRVKKEGSWWMGTLTRLTYEALAILPFELDRPLNEERLRVLYEKSCAGCNYRSSDSWQLGVSKHKFCKWVARNWHRILITSKELRALANNQDLQQQIDDEDAVIEIESVVDSRS